MGSACCVTIWVKWQKNSMIITKSTFLGQNCWGVGYGSPVNFLGSGGIPSVPPHTRGNPACKLWLTLSFMYNALIILFCHFQ